MSRRQIIVFDGACVLCSRWVRFVLHRDQSRRFRFAAMQSDVGRSLLIEQGIDPDDPVTFLLVDGHIGHTDTDAALRVVSQFNRPWKFFAAVLQLIPRFIRDRLYRWIARNRYRLFGRRASCYLPAPGDADRFL